MRLLAPRFWESSSLLVWLLLPLTGLYGLLLLLRKCAYKLGILSSTRLPVPLLIVGNIRVGGTGKTPLVIALVKALQIAGYSPGIIARGYRSAVDQTGHSREVLADDLASDVGDEPALIAQQLAGKSIPLWIGRQRASTALCLLAKYPSCNVIVCDDGLQHYALARLPARLGGTDIEMVVQDTRGNGNGFLLPAGPLRESSSRARDLTIQMMAPAVATEPPKLPQPEITEAPASSFHPDQVQTITTTMGSAYRLHPPQDLANNQDALQATQKSLAELAASLRTSSAKEVAALAGIAYPEKFFAPLRPIFGQLTTLSLPDHEEYTTNPFSQFPATRYQILLITEKDAVKCRKWVDDRVWVVPLEANIPPPLLSWILSILDRNRSHLPCKKESNG